MHCTAVQVRLVASQPSRVPDGFRSMLVPHERAILRSIGRQLLGQRLDDGDLVEADILGHPCRLGVTLWPSCTKSVIVRAETELVLSGADTVEVAAVDPVSSSLYTICQAAWAHEISELVDIIDASIHNTSDLPAGLVPRGAVLEALAGGGKTTMLRYMQAAVNAHNANLQTCANPGDVPVLPSWATPRLPPADPNQAWRVAQLDELETDLSACSVELEEAATFSPALPRITLLTFEGLDALSGSCGDEQGSSAIVSASMLLQP